MARRNSSSSGHLSEAVPRRRRDRLRRFRRYFVSGFVFTVALILMELLFETYTVAGREFRLMGYRLIQHRLSSTVGGPLPVVVVDISDLEPTVVPGAHWKATPRSELERILKAIAGQNPSAIAIDIDFSPDPGDEKGDDKANDRGWIDPRNDPEFFQTCLSLRGADDRSIPVFLGVQRTQSLQPEFWLGDEQYETLAAAMIIPRDPRTMIAELQVSGSPTPLKSLALHLADTYKKQSPPRWARLFEDIGLLESTSSPHLKFVPEFSVDYSPRQLLEDETIRYEQLQTLDADQLKKSLFHKMVIVGAAELDKTNDIFAVLNEPMAGTIIHACAAYTLVQSAPLYELTFFGDIAIDMVLSVVGLSLVGAIWYGFPGRKIAVDRVRLFTTLLVAAGGVLVGVMLVRHTHVLWDGFLIVLLALALHHPFESLIEWIHESMRRVTE